jgi:hypothetical protein
VDTKTLKVRGTLKRSQPLKQRMKTTPENPPQPKPKTAEVHDEKGVGSAAICSACGLPWDRHPGIAVMCGKFCHVVDTLGWVMDTLKHHHRRRPGINRIIEEVDRRMATKPNTQALATGDGGR